MTLKGRSGPKAALSVHRLEGAVRALDLAEPAVMGVLNVTPDSFSDGGQHVATEQALDRALAMVDEGARIIDIGGESTRPGANPVPAVQELDRVIPVIERVRAHSDVFISIDTVKPEVMLKASSAGADMINDVMALRAPGALEAAVETGAAVCLMHMQGEPRTMQQRPTYGDVVAEVAEFLASRVAACEKAGIVRSRLCIDPGFGFGKALTHNLALMRDLERLAVNNVPMIVGVSRKSMFSKLCGEIDETTARINGSLAAAFWAVTHGVQIVRAHDVCATCQVLALAQALVDE